MYPHLTEILNEMFLDNYGTLCHACIKLEEDWVWPSPKTAAALEEQAAKLSETEKLIMAAGEHTEQKTVVKKHHCQDLSNFLGDVFDGPLSSNFLHNDVDN